MNPSYIIHASSPTSLLICHLDHLSNLPTSWPILSAACLHVNPYIPPPWTSTHLQPLDIQSVYTVQCICITEAILSASTLWSLFLYKVKNDQCTMPHVKCRRTTVESGRFLLLISRLPNLKHIVPLPRYKKEHLLSKSAGSSVYT